MPIHVATIHLASAASRTYNDINMLCMFTNTLRYIVVQCKVQSRLAEAVVWHLINVIGRRE